MQFRQLSSGYLILLIITVISILLFGTSRSSDLMSTWIAGQMYSVERFSEIYVTSQPLFTMQPNDSWVRFMADGFQYQDAIFPYLYPPIWAWAFAQISDVSFIVIGKYALIINSMLMSGCIFLAHRLTRTKVPLSTYSLIAIVLIYFSTFGALALFENQPQILVTFLILLTIERLRAGSKITAGSALALAAAIKIYPAIFVLFLIASNEKKAAVSFFVVGLTLAVSSIYLVGWPLHLEFLRAAGAVSNTAMVVFVNYNIHGVIGQLFFPDELEKILSLQPAVGGEIPYWEVIAKGKIWRVTSFLALLGILTVTFRMFKKSDDLDRFQVCWPVALTLIPFFTPIGWSYYYIATAALAPILLQRYPTKVAIGIFALVFLLTSIPSQFILNAVSVVPSSGQITGSIAVLILCIAYAMQPESKKLKKPI